MDLGLSHEQEQLVSSFAGLLSKQSAPEAVRAAEPGGADEALWRSLHDVGALSMAVEEANGGWGASTVDLALVAEQIGRAAAAAPLVEVQVALRLLAATGAGAAHDLVREVLDHGAIVTVAIHPARGAQAPLVPAGAVCQACIVRRDDDLVLHRVDDGERTPVDNLACAPLADLHLDPAAGLVLLSGPDAVAAYEAALDEWLTLTAAALVGLGTAALDLACAYARERRAFGSPIGAFQGVAHPLADDATALDGARLLARKAAWSLDGRRPRARELAAMAFAFASRAAEAATYHGIHVHGGYGFMLEYDVQLHYRRARGWARVWGDAQAGYDRAADHRYRSGAGVA